MVLQVEACKNHNHKHATLRTARHGSAAQAQALPGPPAPLLRLLCGLRRAPSRLTPLPSRVLLLRRRTHTCMCPHVFRRITRVRALGLCVAGDAVDASLAARPVLRVLLLGDGHIVLNLAAGCYTAVEMLKKTRHQHPVVAWFSRVLVGISHVVE
jgi:hypothetical protein